MIRVGMFICLFLLNASFIFPQTTYYISSSQGNDNNSGNSEGSPWKTIAKVNSRSFNPSDNILFKRGDFWVGEQLFINRSGTASERIKYASYGDGLKPVITTKSAITGWDNPSNWTEVSGYPNVWRMILDCSSPIDRLWLNGTEVQAASWWRLDGWIMGDNLYAGDNGDGTNGVNSTHKFHYVREVGWLNLYSTSNPATAYTSIEAPANVMGTISQHTIELNDADYVTLDGLDIQGGLWASIGLGGSDYAKIINCNVGKNTNWHAITGQSYYSTSSDKTCDYVEIANDTIYSGWNFPYVFYNGRTPMGILIYSGGSYWEIHDSYIADWWYCIDIYSSSNTHCLYNKIYNNEITSPNFSATKAIQLVADEHSVTGDKQYTEIYNNYIHDVRVSGIHFASGGNKVYFNIIRDVTASLNSHFGYQDNSGFGIQTGYSDQPNQTQDSNYVFNNTFYNLNMHASIFGSPLAYNNLYLNNSMAYGHSLSIKQYSFDTYKNNLFYRTGSSSSTQFIQYGNSTYYTVAEFNALGESISGNIYPATNDVMTEIINSDFTLPVGSEALNAGIDISALVPVGFTDRNGNVINRTNPNIGAIDNSAQEATGLQIYLQGAFANGIMKTALKEGGSIPKTQPYNISPFNYNGNEYVQTVPSEIVDWVLIELRSDISSSSIVAKRAGFVRNDGSIVDLDGRSKLRFDGVNSGNYYVVIRHRNHLSIMSAGQVPLSESSLNYDFTASRSGAYGNDLTDLGNGRFAMYAGDGDANGTVNVLDYGTVGSNLFQTGYMQGDLDLNGTVNVLDYGKANQNLLKVSNVP